MALVDRVRITRRFQRAIRIDTDVGKSAALEGYIIDSFEQKAPMFFGL